MSDNGGSVSQRSCLVQFFLTRTYKLQRHSISGHTASESSSVLRPINSWGDTHGKFFESPLPICCRLNAFA